MHEYSIARALLSRVHEEARARCATRVVRLAVALGELSGVEPRLLASAFALAREGTLCSGAEMDVHPVKACWACPACGAEPAPGGPLRCPQCAGDVRLRAGDEIVLERIEMEVP